MILSMDVKKKKKKGDKAEKIEIYQLEEGRQIKEHTYRTLRYI